MVDLFCTALSVEHSRILVNGPKDPGAVDGPPLLGDPAVAKLTYLPLDVRPPALFGDAHAAGSVNIGVAGPSFSVWCGCFVNPDQPIALVAEYETEAQQAQLELARIGFDHVVGFISADDLDETLQITQMGARDFLASLESSWHPLIIDVRSAQEWSHDHLEGAVHIPLPHLLRRIGGISRNAPVTVVCASGYRSSIAASLLESEGFERLVNVMGGMHAVRHAKRPRLPVMVLFYRGDMDAKTNGQFETLHVLFEKSHDFAPGHESIEISSAILRPREPSHLVRRDKPKGVPTLITPGIRWLGRLFLDKADNDRQGHDTDQQPEQDALQERSPTDGAKHFRREPCPY